MLKIKTFDRKKVHEVNNGQIKIITITNYKRQSSFKKYLSDGFYYYAKEGSDICQLPLRRYMLAVEKPLEHCTPNLINLTFMGGLLAHYCLLKEIKEQGFYPADITLETIDKEDDDKRLQSLKKEQGFTRVNKIIFI